MIIVPQIEDPEVRTFVAQQLTMALSPYYVPQFEQTAHQLIADAVARFGDQRTSDILLWIH